MRKRGSMFQVKWFLNSTKNGEITDKFISLCGMSGILLAHVACHVTSTCHLSHV